MMISPPSYLVNLECPHCDKVQPYSQLFRTDDVYLTGALTGVLGALGRPLVFWQCCQYEKRLRLADYRKPRRFLLFGVSLFITFSLGSSILDQVSLFKGSALMEAGYLKFTVAGALAVHIAIWLSSRSLKVEIIK